jgi:hypothetical protein
VTRCEERRRPCNFAAGDPIIRMPFLFVFRDLILPVIYIDAWITDELSGAEMK